MKVLLLEPFVDDKTKWGSFAVEKGYIPPLGMIAIYSFLKKNGVEIELLDTQFPENGEQNVIEKIRTDTNLKIIGIPVFTNSAACSFVTARKCREARPDIVIVLGGVHASSMPERTMNECPSADYIVIGEGEITFLELISAVSTESPVNAIKGICYRDGNKAVVNPPREMIENLDDLPRICYEDLNLERYVPHPTQYKLLPNYPMITQRGCPFTCTFCEASLIHGKKPRRYSPQRVLTELKLLVNKFGARGIYFQDSTFTLNKKYVIDLMEGIISNNIRISWACNTRCDMVDPDLLKLMKRAGCWMISYGIESANQQSLDLLRKGTNVAQIRNAVANTRKAGISMLCSYILCLPGEDESMVENTIRFSKELLSDIALFYLPVPYPGSELHKICLREKSIRENAPWEDYLAVDFSNPVYINRKIGKDKMVYYYKKAYREYYLNPRYLLRTVLGVRSIADMKRYARGFRALSGTFMHGRN